MINKEMGAEDVRAGSYFVKHLEMSFRIDI